MSNLYQKTKARLAESYEINEAAALAKIIFTSCFAIPALDLYTGKGIELTAKQQQELETILKKLLTGTPIQYILGYEQFYQNTFVVTPDVLIPRPETEELVTWIMQENVLQTPRIIDIGTGSGCIALTLAANLSEAQVTALDISPKALQVAQTNAQRLQVKVQFIEMDILEDAPKETFDIVVSNPPYIAEKERQTMDVNVLNYEPETALFVPNEDPLRFYRSIALHAHQLLNEGGKLYFEINQVYGNEMIQLLSNLGYQDIVLRKDMYLNDRMIRAVR
jgi:release factor glutamine methyltransferase